MHRLSFLVCFVLGAGANAGAAGFETLQLMPKPQADLIAIIEGKGGAPLPEEWTVVVHDPQGVSGVREYIIAGTEIVSQRAVSQMAPSLTPADALGVEQIKVFPTQLAEVGQLYAQTNGLALGALDYQLRKGADATPLWTVTCRDEAGGPLGVLVIAAEDGHVVSHEGFAQAPPAAALHAAFTKADTEFLDSDEARTDGPQRSRKRSSAKRTSKPKGNAVSRSLRKVGATLQKFFTGR